MSRVVPTAPTRAHTARVPTSVKVSLPHPALPRFADVIGRRAPPVAAPIPRSAAHVADHAPTRTVRAAENDDERRGGPRREEPAPVDPAMRLVAQLAPPLLAPSTPPADAPVVRAMRSLEDLLPAVVRKIAWAGDARRGSVRLELGGDGAYAGAVVVVHADAGVVRVDVSGRDDAAGLRERLEDRLRRRGLDVDEAR